MWTNNGFGNNEGFQNNFSNQGDGHPRSPFADSQGQQQYFPQLPFPPNIMQFEGGNGESFMINDFQPEMGLYNEGAYTQNQFVNRANAQFSPPHLNSNDNNMLTANTPTPLRPITNISMRAAELKAQLLRGRERASSATPPIGLMGQVTKPPGARDGSSSVRGSPTTPATATEASEQELNIKELISQYAGPKPPANTEMKDDRIGLPIHPKRPSSLPKPSAKSQVPSLGSPTKVSKPNNSKMIYNGLHTKDHGSGHAGSDSMSEGEVLEDGSVKKALPSIQPKETKVVAKAVVNKEASGSRRTPDEQPLKSSRGPRETSPRRSLPSNSKRQAPRYPEDHGDETDPRQDRRPYTSKYTNEREAHPLDAERSPHRRRDSREQNEDHHTSGIKSEERDDRSRTNREARPPTLSNFLPHDEDLKEWLEITGYHNENYRDKILNRRRAIAALDAQRNALLAEMEAEERGGIQVIGGGPIPASAMLPPPIRIKVGDRTEPSATPTNTAPETQRDRVVSKKRSQSDAHDSREESSSKIARTTDRASRIKQEDDADYGRPRSSGYAPSRRRPCDDRPHSRDSSRPRYDEDRGRGRGSSRERDISPGRKAYDSRAPARTRAYEAGGDNWMRDRYDWEERGERGRERSDRRPFEIRGGYRGRAFDPNYRNRGGHGGGRGRGDVRLHMEPKSEPDAFGAFGARIANGKPFRDSGGFDRGGKGDTRYFIIKSFNEENVMKCIEDGIWTTQVQNGPLFEDAFERCKNVILVFSINKSRAFQGYARMESLPGSVEMPAWQRAINWESAGAFKIRWLVICATRFQRIGHLKNALNEDQAVLVGKDGQEIEENCGRGLIELIDEEVDQAMAADWRCRKERQQSWEL